MVVRLDVHDTHMGWCIARAGSILSLAGEIVINHLAGEIDPMLTKTRKSSVGLSTVTFQAWHAQPSKPFKVCPCCFDELNSFKRVGFCATVE
jgi:hypothetical protein